MVFHLLNNCPLSYPSSPPLQRQPKLPVSYALFQKWPLHLSDHRYIILGKIFPRTSPLFYSSTIQMNLKCMVFNDVNWGHFQFIVGTSRCLLWPVCGRFVVMVAPGPGIASSSCCGQVTRREARRPAASPNTSKKQMDCLSAFNGIPLIWSLLYHSFSVADKKPIENSCFQKWNGLDGENVQPYNFSDNLS